MHASAATIHKETIHKETRSLMSMHEHTLCQKKAGRQTYLPQLETNDAVGLDEVVKLLVLGEVGVVNVGSNPDALVLGVLDPLGPPLTLHAVAPKVSSFLPLSLRSILFTRNGKGNCLVVFWNAHG